MQNTKHMMSTKSYLVSEHFREEECIGFYIPTPQGPRDFPKTGSLDPKQIATSQSLCMNIELCNVPMLTTQCNCFDTTDRPNVPRRPCVINYN